MAQTSRYIRPFLEILFPGASEQTLLAYHAYIRKFAHFAEYAAAGFFAARAFSKSSVQLLKNHWILISLGLILTIAMLDETNQSLQRTRTASIWDVLLDFTGGITAIVIYYLITRIERKSFDY